MKKLIFSSLAFISINAGAQTLPVYFNDTTFKAEPIICELKDSVKGPEICRYTNYPDVIAYSIGYYNGYKNGFVKIYYPSGKLMQTNIYQKSKKNGEETIYNELGQIMIKGVFVNDVKDGFWIYRNYKFMGKYKKGLKDGIWRQTTPEGKKVILYYNNGKLKKQKGNVVGIPFSIFNEGISTEQ